MGLQLKDNPDQEEHGPEVSGPVNPVDITAECEDIKVEIDDYSGILDEEKPVFNCLLDNQQEAGNTCSKQLFDLRSEKRERKYYFEENKLVFG